MLDVRSQPMADRLTHKGNTFLSGKKCHDRISVTVKATFLTSEFDSKLSSLICFACTCTYNPFLLRFRSASNFLYDGCKSEVYII